MSRETQNYAKYWFFLSIKNDMGKKQKYLPNIVVAKFVQFSLAASTGASGRKNCREWSGYFICGAGGDVGGGVDGDDVVAFCVGAGDIWLSKRNVRGPNE